MFQRHLDAVDEVCLTEILAGRQTILRQGGLERSPALGRGAERPVTDPPRGPVADIGDSRLRADEKAIAAIGTAAELLAAAFRTNGRAFSCGNGGSLCDAMHFAEELSGRFRGDRRPLPAIAIADPGHLTCVANDYGYDGVFARFIAAHGREGDVLLAISTSGRSRNVVAAAETARRLGLRVIGLTGKAGSPLAAHSDVEICTPAGSFADRVQELHIKVLHVLIECIERLVLRDETKQSP